MREGDQVTTKQALKMAGVAIDGLAVIQGLSKVGGDKAAAALSAIGTVVETLQDGLAGKATPEVVAGDIAALVKRISDNDAAADAALAARFP